MNNDIFAKRLSVRRFKPDPVPQELLRQLIRAATAAPSAGNCQPWHFYIVQNEAVKEKLCESAYNQKFIKTAPVVFVVCTESTRSTGRYGERGESLYVLQDTAAAIENILLCAAQNGLGACWCGAFDEEAVSRSMDLPETRRPVAVIPLGYPKGPGIKPIRRPLKDVMTTIE